MNIIRNYWKSVYHYILLIVPSYCLCAGTFITIFKLLGKYPEISWFQIGLFDFTQLVDFGITFYFIYQNKKDSSYFLTHIFSVKAFITISLTIQYNFLLYLLPTEYTWGCTFLFFLIPVFFFDTVMTIIHIFIYLFSLAYATY